MRMHKTASLGEIVSSKSFAKVTATTSQLSKLEAILGLYLDAGLRSACRISSFNAGVLSLVSAQAATASHLRYLSRIITQQLRQHAEFSELKQLRVLVYAPPMQAPERPKLPHLRLSAATAQLLRETAHLLDDPEISGALERLARHGDEAEKPPTPGKAGPGPTRY